MDSSPLLIVGIYEINSKWPYLQICGAVLMVKEDGCIFFIFSVESHGMINLNLFRPFMDIHF